MYMDPVPHEPLANLSTRIASEVHKSHVRRVRVLVGIALPLFIGSFLLGSPAVRFLGEELSRSGFREYFSVLFSDPGFVFSNLGVFISAVIESLPTFGIALTLIVVVSFFIALRNIITAFHSPSRRGEIH